MGYKSDRYIFGGNAPFDILFEYDYECDDPEGRSRICTVGYSFLHEFR